MRASLADSCRPRLRLVQDDVPPFFS